MLALPLAVCLVTWCAAAPVKGQAANDPAPTIEPNAAAQAAIGDVRDADSRAAEGAALDALEALTGGATQDLVRQLTYFASRAKDMRDRAAVGRVLRGLEIPDVTIARALTPYVATTDAALREAARSLLGEIEQRAPGRRPDFSAYRALIAERVRARADLPSDLVAYMYEENPGEALLALMRAHQLRRPDDLRPLLWTEHVVSETLWKQRHGFLKPEEVEPDARTELAKLARHEQWWARLYVAAIMRKHAEFRDAELIKALQADQHALVRAFATTI